MKISAVVETRFDFDGTKAKVANAARKAMRDVVVDIAHDAVQGSPVLTGNNRRSIKYEASGFPTGGEGVVDQNKNEGAVYSTSGYGGMLETGTKNMPARPYFKPALDRNISKLGKYIKEHLESER